MAIVFAIINRFLDVLFQFQLENIAWLLGVLTGALVLALILLAWLAVRLARLTASHQHSQTRLYTLEQFRLFLDNLSDVAVIMNKDSTIRYVSPSVKNILGYVPEDLIGKTPWGLLHPDSPGVGDGRRAAEFAELSQQQAPFTPTPQRILRKDGSVRWIEASINVQLDNPRINGIFLVARDITERMQAEQVLRESENRFRTIADSTPMLIWMAEPDGKNSFNNKWLVEFTGLPQQELEGNNWRRVLHPDDVAGFETTDNEVLQKHEPFTHEYRLRRHDGHYRWMLDIGIPRFSPDGSFLGFIGTVQDINERKDAEAALQEREAQYRSIFESVSDGLEISDPVTRQVIDVNPAMCAMHGYTREEYINLPNNTFVAPGNPYFTGQYLDAFSNTNEMVPSDRFIGRSVNVHKDGHVFDVQVAVKTIYQNGKLRLLTVVRDITEQVTVTHVLEQAVIERTNHLRQLLDVSQAISSTLDLDSLLQLILERLRIVVPYTAAFIALVDPPGRLMVVKLAGLHTEGLVDLEWAYKPEDQHINHILDGCQPVNIKDLNAAEPFAQALRAGLVRLLGYVPAHLKSWLGVPMISEDQAIGLLILEADTGNAYDEQAIERIMPFANHAATAIENSRLKDTAMQSAVYTATMAERGRIARELHDSVSQALFGIVLGARTAKEQTERVLAQQRAQQTENPTSLNLANGKDRRAAGAMDAVTLNAIDYTLNLAEGALAEMRTLIFELRPESLAQEGLAAALQKQALGLMARQKIDVETSLDREPDLPMSSKEAMYRIAVEALQNIVKHSGATRVKLMLKQQPMPVNKQLAEATFQTGESVKPDEIVVLTIIDNGRGFDPEAFYPGHMGLQSMRERAEQIKGRIDMDSNPGGTEIMLTVPIQPTRLRVSPPASRAAEATPTLPTDTQPDEMKLSNFP